MAVFLLIPGAGGEASYWNRLAPLLIGRGHQAIPVQLPAADDRAGLQAYADQASATLRAAPRRADAGPLVVVAQSMGGLSAPLVAQRELAAQIVLLNAMTPRPGETGGQWWGNTGQAQASADYVRRLGLPDGRADGQPFDVDAMFFHDLPPQVRDELLAGPEPAQSDRPFEDPWPLDRWPGIPTRFLQGRDDRLFPLEFQRRVVRERLGLDVEELPGGHLLALSQPAALTDALLSGLPR